MVAQNITDESFILWGKVRAPPEKMPDNNRAGQGSCHFYGITPELTESAAENNRLETGKGEKAG